MEVITIVMLGAIGYLIYDLIKGRKDGKKKYTKLIWRR
jgi:hypothetical protein